MAWYEYIFIVIAVSLVALPFLLAIKNKKKHLGGCCCEYSCKGSCDNCPFKKMAQIKAKAKTN